MPFGQEESVLAYPCDNLRRQTEKTFRIRREFIYANSNDSRALLRQVHHDALSECDPYSPHKVYTCDTSRNSCPRHSLHKTLRNTPMSQGVDRVVDIEYNSDTTGAGYDRLSTVHTHLRRQRQRKNVRV